jgi:hypothetical protein
MFEVRSGLQDFSFKYRNARELVDEFNRSLPLPPITIQPPLSSRSSSVGSEFLPESVERAKKRCLPSDSEMDSEPEQDELDDLDEKLDLDLTKMGDLEKLFDPEFRQLEAEALTTTEESLNRNKNYYGPTTTTSIVETLVAQNERQTQFNDYMMFVPTSEQCTPLWTQHSAVISLSRVIQATAVLPDLTTNMAKTSILDRSLRWEIARSNMLLYAWYRDTGPRLALTLVDAHRKGAGFPGVHRAHPIFARFVHHIYSYVVAQSRQKKAAKKARRQKAGTTSRIRKEPTPLHPISSFEVPDAELGSLPFDLYGLRESTSKKRVALRLPAKRVALDNDDAIYACTTKIIQEIWSTELILPPLVSMDKVLGSSKRNLDNLDLIRDRAITRGAVLQCIVDACGGDDSILASSDMEALLGCPARMFSSRIRQEKKFAAGVLNNPDRNLAHLADWLASRLEAYPSILVYAARVARVVHRGLLELHYGLTLSDEHFLNPDMLYDESEDVPFLAPALERNPQSNTRKKNTYFLSPTVDSILSDSEAPYFGAIGLILRERCNEMRDFKEASPILRNVLQGRHPTQGREQFDRDQTDPARQHSEYAKLLCDALPASQLTGRLGISRLLAYMGTGQGNKTRSFVCSGRDTANNLFPMLFENLADCVNRFETFELSNMSILADFRATSSSRAARIPGYKQTYNACIWGQASNHLLLQPTIGKAKKKRKISVEEKFAPYFSNDVQDKWVNWLAGLYGQDPATYQGTKNSWSSALRFILDLNVLGFQSGLTPLQFANNLVFLGICDAPDPFEVANWIASNKSLGAYNGLVKLGFSLTGYASIDIAYTAVYKHLEANLSDDDKERLGFGTLFVEHLLCKVGRWEYRLRLQKLDFMLMAREAAIGVSWIKGANATDNLAFPIPLSIDRKDIQGVIDSCMVSTTKAYSHWRH